MAATRRPRIPVNINQKSTHRALVDTGSDVTLIRKDIAEKNGIWTNNMKEELHTISGEKMPVEKANARVSDKIVEAVITDRMNEEVVIGVDFLKGAIINLETKEVEIAERIFPIISTVEKEEFDRARIDTVVGEYAHIFYDKTRPLTPMKDVPAQPITTFDGPVSQAAYRPALSKRSIIESEIAEMLKDGVIRPSSSEWASPILLVGKKDGSQRFCVDYRAVNAVTRKDRYPLPRITDIFDSLCGAAVFTTLDLKAGYWQLTVKESDVCKTAFITHRGLYEFLRLPFGLANAPGQFQRVMSRILEPVVGVCAFVYIDDIVVFSKSESDHIRDLRTVFELLDRHNVTIKKEKCDFAKKQVELLGYVVSPQGIAPTAEKTMAVKAIRPPNDVKGVKSILGLTNYYRSSIAGYARIVEPIVALTRKGVKFEWSPECEKSLDRLKEALCSAPILAYPDPNKPYRLYTDACDYAVGAVLVQTDDNGLERVVHYLSTLLDEVQRRWATIEKEAYGIIYALKKLRCYLLGAEFVILTDHKPLKSLFNSKIENAKLQRWAIRLSEFGAPIEYRKGIDNERADALSRFPDKTGLPVISAVTRSMSNKSESDRKIGKDRLELDRVEDNEDDETDFDCDLTEIEVARAILGRDGLSRDTLAADQRAEYDAQWREAEEDNESEWFIHDGLLVTDRPPYKGASYKFRVVLPQNSWSSAIKKAHERVGHMSVDKTLHEVAKNYAWPRLRATIQSDIDACPQCQLSKRKKDRPAPIDPEIPLRPMSMIGCDHIGPFSPDEQGRKYVLTIICLHSNWTEAYPVRDTSAAELIRCFEQDYLPRHGRPDVLICDNGQGFGSRAFEEFLRFHEIELRHSTPYHPQGNSRVERFNRTLKETIVRLCANRPHFWSDVLGPALGACRVAESSATGFSPFQLLYGRRPGELFREFHGSTYDELKLRYGEMSEAHAEARKNLKESRKYNFERNMAQARAEPLRVGDPVLLHVADRVTHALRWEPGFEVVAIFGTTVAIRNNRGVVRHVHRERVRFAGTACYDNITPRPVRTRGPCVEAVYLGGEGIEEIDFDRAETEIDSRLEYVETEQIENGSEYRSRLDFVEQDFDVNTRSGLAYHSGLVTE